MSAVFVCDSVEPFVVCHVFEGRNSQVSWVLWVMTSFSWQDKANEHLSVLFAIDIYHLCIVVRVCGVVCKVDTLAEETEIREANV